MRTPALLLLFATGAFARPIPVYIGTGGAKDGKAEGIYATSFDPDTGSLGPVALAVKYSQPGFLLLHPTKPILYALGAPATPYEDKSSSLAAFRIGAEGKLALLKDLSTGGHDSCHLAIDKTGSLLAIANYDDGSYSTMKLDTEGVPAGAASVFPSVFTKFGPNKERQEGPHAHGVYFDSSDKHLFVVDLGADSVLGCTLNAKTLKVENGMDPGAGPRHMALSPDGRHAYVINELNNSVTACGVTDGKLEKIQSIPTLPDGWSGTNYPSEIEVSADGKFVYGSNRGHESIVVYARDSATGRLTLVQIAPCGGDFPRHFKIAPGGKWLVCANGNSKTLTVLAIDPSTGRLGSPGTPVPCPDPICVLFAPER